MSAHQPGFMSIDSHPGWGSEGLPRPPASWTSADLCALGDINLLPSGEEGRSNTSRKSIV